MKSVKVLNDLLFSTHLLDRGKLKIDSRNTNSLECAPPTISFHIFGAQRQGEKTESLFLKRARRRQKDLIDFQEIELNNSRIPKAKAKDHKV